MRKIKTQGYLLALAVGFAACALPLWLSAAFLWRSGEMLSSERIVDVQQSETAIWSTAIFDNEPAYKLALYRRIKPDIVAIGSSRVLQMRGRHFKGSFVNLGRGLNFGRLAEEMRSLTGIHRPSFVMVGLDHWAFDEAWFSRWSNKTTIVAASGLMKSNQRTAILSSEVIAPYELMLKGKITPDQFLTTAGHADRRPGRRLGIRGNLFDLGGYDREGSFYYFDSYRRPMSTCHANRDRIIDAAYQLSPHPQLSTRMLDAVAQGVAYMRQQGIDVAMTLMPLEPRAAAMYLADPRYAEFSSSLSAALKDLSHRLDVDFVDAVDPARLGMANSEFFDSIHPGEVATARILLEVGRSPRQTARHYLAEPALHSIVSDHAGEAHIPEPLLDEFGIRRLEPLPARGGC